MELLSQKLSQICEHIFFVNTVYFSGMAGIHAILQFNTRQRLPQASTPPS
jgi:hypothetical protein